MKEKIAAKLKGISNLEDRLLLKQVLNEVFLELCEYSTVMHHQLEERVFAEMKETSQSYDVYTTVVSRRNIDPIHYFLRTMQTADVTEQRYDLNRIKENIRSRELCPLLKVFLNCDYQQLHKNIAEERIFHGRIITDQGELAASFRLRQDRSYLQQMVELYYTFLNNNIPWTTINHPYIFRFVEVILQECPQLPNEDASIKSIEVDFEELTPYVQYDMVPLWNVETLDLKSSGFPLPCQDKINFEYTINLESTGVEHGYLIVSSEDLVKYSRRTPKALLIGTRTTDKETFSVTRIISPSQDKNQQHEYPLLSNAKRQGFVDMLTQRSLRVIRTEGELRRLTASFSEAQSIRLDHIKLVPRTDETNSVTYEMNFFIRDEIRRSDYQSKLLLYFIPNDRSYFLNWDVMSFVISEIQRNYPDYKCEGILL